MSRRPRLFGGFPDAIVIVDARGRILQANAQAAALFDVRESQLEGIPIQSFFPGQPVPSFDRWPRRNQAGRCAELTASRGGSQRFRAVVAVMPIETQSDAVAAISIRDLTEAQETQFVLERGVEMLSAVISSR